MSDGQKITIHVHDKKEASSKRVEVKSVSKRKEHFKKFLAKLGDEIKDTGVYFVKAFVSLFKALLYALVVLGDLIIIWQKGSKEKASNKPDEPKKKNILDGGW